RLDVVGGAEAEDALQVGAGDGRHEGQRAGGQHAGVEVDVTALGAKAAAPGVQGEDATAGVEVDAVLCVPAAVAKGQVGGGPLAGQHLAEPDPVVGRPRLVAEDGDPPAGPAAHELVEQRH